MGVKQNYNIKWLTHVSPLYVELPFGEGIWLVLKQRSPVCQVKQSNFNKERDRLLSGLLVSVRRHCHHPEGNVRS